MASASADSPPVRVAYSAYGLLLAGTALWCAAIVAAPLFSRLGGAYAEAAALLYSFFHPICHQLDSHSLHIGGSKLGVCARCFSVYAGFLLGLLLYPAVRPLRATLLPHRVLLIGAAVPMLLDVGLSLLGFPAGTQLTRILTGTVFGLAAPFFLVPAVIEGFAQLLASSPLFTNRSHPHEGISDATET